MNAETKFCDLTLSSKKKYEYDVHEILHGDEKSISRLFIHKNVTPAEFKVIEQERELALKKLRTLTSELQTGRVKIKLHELCDYFIL